MMKTALNVYFSVGFPDNLSVSAGQASLNAATVWGILRGDLYFLYRELSLGILIVFLF